MIKEDIENNLKTSLDVIFLEVINESNMHNVPDGAESHFKITIVSDIFEDMRPVQRHQKIYEIFVISFKKFTFLYFSCRVYFFEFI